MAVDPNIKKKADDIRNKTYGKEVRESLASGLEAMSSDVVENEGRQSVVESRQDSVESQWQSVSDEMTDKDVISAPEIIAARNGEPNLKSRLDKEKQEVNAQLAQTVENVSRIDNRVISIYPTGVDQTDEFEALRGSTIILDEGTYYVSDLHLTENTQIIGKGIGNTVIMLTDNTDTDLMTLVGREIAIIDLTLHGNKNNNGVQNENTSIVNVGSSNTSVTNGNLKIRNVKIQSGAGNGLNIGGSSTWVYHLDNVYILQCEGFGMIDGASDNTYSNFYINLCKKGGLKCRGTSNMYSNFKIDWSGGDTHHNLTPGAVYTPTEILKQDRHAYANLIIDWASNLRFVNLDVQSASQVGIKIFNSSKIEINGTVNHSGTLGYYLENIDYYGLGLYVDTSEFINGSMMFYDGQQGYQKTDIEITNKTENITLNVQTLQKNHVINNGFNTKVLDFNRTSDIELRNNTLIREQLYNIIKNPTLSEPGHWEDSSAQISYGENPTFVGVRDGRVYIQTNLGLQENRVYYLRVILKTQSDKVGVEIRQPVSPYSQQGVVQNHSGSGQFETLHQIFKSTRTATQSFGSVVLRVFDDRPRSEQTPVEIENVTLIDLTSKYGTGKEPINPTIINEMIRSIPENNVNPTGSVPPQFAKTNEHYLLSMVDYLTKQLP